MIKAVVDSSVLIAMMRGEPLAEDVLDFIDGALISSVNLAEVFTRLLDLHISFDEPRFLLTLSVLAIEPFTAAQAHVAAELRPTTRSRGLSLGDRACLALAMELGAIAYTTDRAWLEVSVPCEVRLLR